MLAEGTTDSGQWPRLHWDTSDEPGLQMGGGTWDDATVAWNPAADGSMPRVAWQPGAIAVFDGAGVGSGQGTWPRVLLAAGIKASGIEAHTIELVGGELRAAAGGLMIHSRREIVLSCAVSGPGALTLTGSGGVVLTRPTAVTGGWTLRSGTLRFFDARSLGTATVTVAGNATLSPGTANIVIENPIVLDAAARLVVESRVAPVTLAGNISGGGEVVATDRGHLVVSGRWHVGCRLTVSSGTVSFAPPQPAALAATIRGGLFRAAKDSLGADARLTIESGGAVAVSGAADSVDVWAESGWIASDSTGTLALDGDATLERPLDLTRLQAACPSLAVGASGTVVLAAGVVGAGDMLRLGGGGGGLEVRAPVTGPVRLVVGNAGATGAVTFAAANTFTGGITIAGATLRVGHSQALPPGPIVLGAIHSNEYSCGLDLTDATIENPITLDGRATIRNSGGGEATLAGPITAGPHRLRLAADYGSTLRVLGAIESTALVSVNCDHIPPQRKTNVVELSPATPNTCTDVRVERGLVLRAREGVGLPQAARLVLAGGVFESRGAFTRELVRPDGQPNGQGGIALLWDRYHGSGFSARGGTLKVRLSGDPALVWGRQPDDSIEPAPRELVLNAPTADGGLEFDIALDLAGETGDRKGEPSTLHTIAVNAGTAAIVRPVSNSGPAPAGIKKSGAGALMLAAVNTYDGPTLVSEGTVVFGSPAAIGGSGRTVAADAAATVAAAYPIDNAFLKRLVSPNAVPFTVALAADSDRPLDFGSDAGAVLRAATLGAIGDQKYSGKLSPCDGIVRTPAPRLPPRAALEAGSPERERRDPSAHAAPLEPPVATASANDRWIDAVWTIPSDPPGGFAVELAHDGGGFEPAGTAWPGERRFPIYLPDPARDLSRLRGELSVRVAAIAADGTSGPWSNVATAHPASRFEPDVELPRRFPGTGDARRYSADDPVRLAEYSAAEKEAQRAAGRDLALRLQSVAGDETGPRHFTIPPGIYRVAPGQIKIKNVRRFAIHAAGATLMVDSEKSGAAFTFEGCADILLSGRPADPSEVSEVSDPSARGLTIDSEQFAMSVGRIMGVNVSAATLDVEILPGYETTLPDEERMLAYRPDGRMAGFQQMSWKGVEPLDGRSVRLRVPALSNPRQHNSVLAVGNLLALHNNVHHSSRTHAAVAANGCRNMTYESIRIVNGVGQPADHRTAGDTVYRDWRLMPTPGTSRLEICGGLGQFSKDGGRFVFEDCEFAAHLDDGINLLSKMSMVARQDAGDTVVVVGPEPTPGQTLTFHDFHTWKNSGTAAIDSREKLAEPETLAAVNAFSASKGSRNVGLGAWRVKLDRPVTLEPFAVAVHSDHRADEIIVRGCLFRDQLAQVMLLQGAKRGLIENNLILRSTGPAVSLQFSQYWWEGPMPGNFVVRNNVIRDNPVWTPVSGMEGSGSISVWAGTHQPVAERILSGFRIEGNTIENPAVTGVLLRNAERAVVRFNRIVNPGAQKIEGEFHGRPAWQEAAGIRLDHVSNAVVTDNEIVLESPWCREGVAVEDTCDAATLTVDRNRVRNVRPSIIQPLPLR